MTKVTDTQAHQVTAAKLAVEAEIEKCELLGAVLHLPEYTD